jgi:hypothetical protein
VALRRRSGDAAAARQHPRPVAIDAEVTGGQPWHLLGAKAGELLGSDNEDDRLTGPGDPQALPLS